MIEKKIVGAVAGLLLVAAGVGGYVVISPWFDTDQGALVTRPIEPQLIPRPVIQPLPEDRLASPSYVNANRLTEVTSWANESTYPWAEQLTAVRHLREDMSSNHDNPNLN